MINVNAVLSTDGWLRNRIARRALRAMINKFDRVFVADEQSQDAFVALGLSEEKLPGCGALLAGHIPPAFNEQLHAKLTKAIGSRPVWLACGVLGTEFDAVLQAQTDAARLTHRLLLILQPADLNDVPQFSANLRAAGINFVCRSQGEEPRHETTVILDDTGTELGLWLRTAPLTFLGRSLTVGGGTNPMDAAALGSAIIHGPDIEDFAENYAKLSLVGATVCVETSKSLAEAVCELSFPDVAARMAHAAWQVESQGSDVVAAVEREILTRIGRETVNA